MTPVVPTINAFLNATAAVLLVCGYLLIRRKRVQQHRKVMMTAFFVSCAFLVCYLVYHVQVGSVPFPRQGLVRAIYLSILGTHTTLAATVPVLAILTFRRGLTGRVGAHRTIAPWPLPICPSLTVTPVELYL